MATHAEPGTSAPARDLSPYPTDYRSWKILAWCGPVFLAAFFCMWGLLPPTSPPFSPNATPDEVKAHFLELRLPIMIGMSVCLTMAAFYMAWSVSIAKVMERIEGPGGLWSKVEMMGGTITCAPLMVACAFWLTGAHEGQYLDASVVHMLYWFGWLLIDLAYFFPPGRIAGATLRC